MKRFLTIVLLINLTATSNAQSLDLQLGVSKMFNEAPTFNNFNNAYLEVAYNINKNIAPVFHFSTTKSRSYSSFNERLIIRNNFVNSNSTPDTFNNALRNFTYRINQYAIKLRINCKQGEHYNLHLSPQLGLMYISEEIRSNYPEKLDYSEMKLAYTAGFDIGFDYFLSAQKDFKLSAAISSGSTWLSKTYPKGLGFRYMLHTQFRLGVSWIFQVGKEAIP